MPQRSIGTSNTPTAVMPSTTSSVSRSRVIRGDLFHRMQRGGRGLARLHEDATDAGMLVEEPAHIFDAGAASPLDLELDDLEAVGRGDLRPALAELAAVDDQHLVARREQVGDRCFHRAGAGRGEDEHVLLGLEDLLQRTLGVREDLAELRRAVVDDRLRHRQEHPRRHRGGTGARR